MDQSRTLTKLLRVLQFRKHVKELTSACKRINKDGCYEFVTARTEPLSTEKKSAKLNRWRSKLYHSRERTKSSCPLSSDLTTGTIECPTVTTREQPLEQMNDHEHLSRATATLPANLSMIVSQSYKPLHAKSTQFNKNTIAVTKGASVKALYVTSNWVFVQLLENGHTGYVPMYCLRFPDAVNPPFESTSQNNISLLNVSIYEKPRVSRLAVSQHRLPSTSTPPPSGRFMSSIGPCHVNNDQQFSTCPRSTKSSTIGRQAKDQSILSRQISNVSLHVYDPDAYGTLNVTPGKSLSYSVLDNESVVFRPQRRLRAIGSYQKQFVGDISVLESEVLTLVDTLESGGDWHLVRRGDGKQGYVPKSIIITDRQFT